MRPATRVRALAIFRQVVDQTPEGRARLVERECRGDRELRAEVERLLEADSRPAGFLERPPALALPELRARAVAAAAPPVRLGRLGRYTIVRLVDSGGMGSVYEAWQERPRRRVALKTLRGPFASQATRRRLRFEAEVLGSLHHPSIAQVFESGVVDTAEGELPFLAMEFVDGARDLLASCRERGLGRRERLALFLEVCDAVAHGHRRGVIHRDLKPSNLLVDGAGRVKVIDFGLARVRAPELASVSVAETRSGEVVGTLRYMAPEQLLGGSADLDLRVDVYALGVVLFELLSGEHPFDLAGCSLAEIARRVENQEPRRLSALDPSLAGDLEWIAARALARQREERYGSVDELAADLRRHLRDEPVGAGPPSALYRLRKLVRRHRVLAGAAALVAAALVAGGGAALWQARVAHARLVERNVQLEVAAAAEAFVTRMLRSARPELARGEEVTARELVDAAARELDADPPAQPDVEASVRATLGATYASLGRHAEAAPHLERALALRLERHGPDDARTLEARLEQLANALELGADDALGERTREAVGATARALGADHPLALRAAEVRASFLVAATRLEEAEVLLRDLVERSRDALGGDHPRTLAAMGLLAAALAERGAVDEAMRWNEAVARARPASSELDPGRILDELAWAGTLLAAGRFDEADARYAEWVPRAERVLGETHPLVVSLAASRGELLAREGLVEEALPHLELALARFRAQAGVETSELLDGMVVGGQGLVSAGRVDDGEALLRQALDAFERRGESGRKVAHRARLCLANAYWMRGEEPRAIELLRTELPAAERDLGADDEVTLLVASNLGGLLSGAGDLAGARPLTERAYEAARARYGLDDPHQTLMAGHVHGVLLRELGELDASRSLLADVLERRERVLGPSHPDTLMTLYELGRACGSAGDFERAEAYLGEADRRIAAGAAVPPMAGAWCVVSLAEVVRAQGRLDECEALLERADGLHAGLPPAQIVTLRVTRARLLHDQGRTAEARAELENALATLDAIGVARDHPERARFEALHAAWGRRADD